MRLDVKHVLVLLVAVLVVAGGAGVAVAGAPARLSASGPTDVDGTAATAVFQVGDRTIRQVRYKDRHALVYRFVLRNDGSLPVAVTGLAPLSHQPTLFRYVALQDADGARRFTVPAGEATEVVLRLRMESCERLSARAGSFATEVALRTSRAGGLVDEVVTVALPEEVHTGSPREAFCARSTASSRPPG